MADRTFPWGRGSSMRRTTELGGRRRHDQQRLLVELELDDSLYQGSLRTGMEQNGLYPGGRRSSYAEGTHHSRQLHSSYAQHVIAEPKPRLQPRSRQDTAAKPRTERQMQQLHARRLSSPYKLKEQVLGTRNEPIPQRHQQHNASASSTQRVVRSSSLPQSPGQLVIESVRQNIHLRDQVMAHLQQELMGVLPLHRASHVEKNVPQRVVKLLNRMRSLSLAVVEAVVYLSSELGANMAGTSVEHEILEQDCYGYLLQMALSDSDFLACSPPLQRFFEDFDVNLTRNPFVDGLTLDSSEVLLCACHQSASSNALFCSASSTSVSLLRLLTHKLETFALQTQRYLPGWQILPAERVAAALLHLMDLETRFNAVQMLPRYLQSHSGYRNHAHQQIQQRSGPEETLYGYGTFGDERIQRLDQQGLQLPRTGDNYSSRREMPLMEAWAGSPTAKTPALSKTGSSSAASDRLLQAKTSDGTAKSSSEARLPASRSSAPTGNPQSSYTSNDSSRRISSKDEDVNTSMLSKTPMESSRSTAKQEDDRKPSLPSSAWVQLPSSTASISGRTNSSPANSSRPPPASAASSREMPVEADSVGTAGSDVNVELTQMLPPPMLDTAALAKSSTRSNSSERYATQKKSRNATDKCSTLVDVGVQMTQRASPEVTATQTTKRLGSSVLMHDEKFQVTVAESARRPPVPVMTNQPESNAADFPARFQTSMPDMDVSESVDLLEYVAFARSDDLLVLNFTGPESFPVSPLVKPLISLRDRVEGVSNGLTSGVGTPTTVSYAESEVKLNHEAETDCDDGYECDFEYSSNEALSSIAMALQMLPNFSLSSAESTLADEVLKPEDAIQPIEPERVESSRMEEHEIDLIDSAVVSIAIATQSSFNASPASTIRSTLLEVDISMESAVSERESVEQRAEVPPPEDDEYAYSSSTAILNIAMALSLLPSISRGDILAVSDEAADHEQIGVAYSRIGTYRSIVSRLEEPWRMASAGDADEVPVEENTEAYSSLSGRNNDPVETSDHALYSLPASSHSYGSALTSERTTSSSPVSSRGSTSARDHGVHFSSPVSSRSNGLATTRDQVMSSLANMPTVINDQVTHSIPASFRSNISAATSYQGDDDSEPSEFNRIFSLCRDIQGTAFDMSHWVSQREVEDHIQSFALMEYSSPVRTNKVDNGPKYLERELKMLRRNLATWNMWVVDHKRAKLVVRRLVARRKVRQFVLLHHRRRVQARIDEENRRRFFATSRIQRNWRVYCHNRKVAERKATFRVVHMAFHRTLFFVGISRRRRCRENKKEKLVRWWRHQRFRIKKKKQRQEKLVRERERRAGALRDVQKFLKEVLLRRKLKAAQELTKKILFKEQLKWTKAKQDAERSMKLNSKHRRELIADMDAKLAELDHKWKSSEEERFKLLTHHERVVQQQQQAVEVRRRKLAALKIQMFFRVCHLHKKLQRVETEKRKYETKFQKELRAKERLDFETQKSIGKTRTQVRVLERKLGRMAQEAVESDTNHREIIQAHQDREKVSQERAARQKIKAFIDARTLCRRADNERRRLLLEQTRLKAEKTEIELMSSEDQFEQHRTAVSVASNLQQRLTEMEAHSEALLASMNQLTAEKEQEAKLATEALEHNRVEANMNQIASWVSGQMQLSKLRKENTAVCALAAHELEEEKQKHCRAIEAKMHEVDSIKASNFMHQRISQRRNQKTVEMIKIQQQQKAAHQKTNAEHTRAQLVQIIIDVKLLTERESNKSIIQGLAGVAQFYKAQLHKFARLKYLRSMNCARNIQQAWRRWTHQQRIKCVQELAIAQLEEAKRRQDLARRVQAWWRKWVQEQQQRREQQLLFDAHLEEIRVRAAVRKVQGVWRHWVKRENERRREQQQVFEARVDAIRTRANVRKLQAAWRRWVKRETEQRKQQQFAFEAQLKVIQFRAYARKIQGAWRRWIQHERERRRQQQLEFDKHLETIKSRANGRKIQGAWRRWVLREREQRPQQHLAFDVHLEAIRTRANVRKIQGVWRRWIHRERERRLEQQIAFAKRLEEIHQRAYVRKIQAAWRRWIQGERARRHVQQLMFKAQLEFIRIRANVRKIQGTWRRWVKSEFERKQQQQLEFDAHLESIRVRVNVRKIQRASRRWVKTKKMRRERRRVHRLVFSSTLRIQRWWRKWQKKRRVKSTRSRIMRNACAQVIQRKWRRWHRWHLAKRERRRLRIQREACARKLQKLWRQWNQNRLAAMRIQRNWRQWQWKCQYEQGKARKLKENSDIRAVERIQRVWRRWHQRSQEKAEQERQEKEEREVAMKIQQNWTGKLFRRNKQEVERKRCLGAQRIQRKWRRWHRYEEAKRSRKRGVEEQRLSVIILQRAWKKWHLTQLENERQEQERRTAAVLVVQHQWRKSEQFEVEGRQRQQHACASIKQEEEQNSQNEDERLQQELVTNVLKIQTLWRKEQKQREDTSSLKIDRNWGIRQHQRKMEQQRIQHDKHMAALKIQTLWLKWHHEQQEELERERIRQEQDESTFKMERNWGISQQRRKVSMEHIRHKQSINALKIQKHWRRWRHLRLEQRVIEARKPRSLPTEPKCDTKPPQQDEQVRQEKLEVITQRSNGRLIACAVRRYLQGRREASAATIFEAIWRGKLYRTQYLQVLETKHAEEVRQYRLMIYVLATKVQLCWRRWHKGIRQAKRAAIKSEELRLIQEAKALEKKLIAAERALAAKRIHRALASRRTLIATKGVSHREVVKKETVVQDAKLVDKVEKVPVDQPQRNESAGDFQEPAQVPADQPQTEEPVGVNHEPVEAPEEDLIRATVEMTVENWGHRELPHILSRSVNQILFCHEAASVLQKCFRNYVSRLQTNFYYQHSFAASFGDAGKAVNVEHFHFYFKQASAWLDWGVSKSTSSVHSAADTNQNVALLRVRIDSQMTRKLLQLFEPSEEYTISEIEQVLQEIAIDALPILQSSVCLEDNDNSRPDLRYHDVEEMELPRSVKLLRQMGQHRAQIRRQQLLEIDTTFEELAVSPPSPVAKSVPASPIGRSAPSSPSQRAKKEVTIFTAVENASVEDATFLEQRGADLGALEPKTQRNALHMLSFSKENYRSRAEMLEFLLTCGSNLNINAVDCNGDTPLMLYASLGHLEFMQKLLQHGADIQMTNRTGQNVLHRACEEDQVEICGFLQQLMMKDSITENMILVDIISSIVSTELSLHTPDSAGRYPLHYLAEKGFVECAKQLMVPTEANYEWNRMLQAQGDSEGRTVLHLAVLTHDVAMTSFLLTPGGNSNVNAFDDLHRSPLHYAVESPAALPIISRLVQHGANLNVADERGDTPLHWTAFSGRAAVTQNLLSLGADPTLVNSDWETPAQIAAAYGQLDCMRLLLQAQRRFGAASSTEPRDQQQLQILNRPASEQTALQRLEEAVNHLHQEQASYHVATQDTDLSTNDANGSKHKPAEQSHGGYWEELHQDVQLVEESGQFSSEDEEDLLFGDDDPTF